jgi:lactate dehydrogenase-like 2-hydroxyacid dehydrogenase
MKLIVIREIPEAVAARVRRDYDPVFLGVHGPFETAMLAPHVEGAGGILCTPADRFDAAGIAALPASVRVIGTYSVGVEHIDLAAAAARGITVCNTPDVLSVATAELALTLMLMAARRAGEGERLLRAGQWRGLTPVFHLGRGVVGKSLGIFGMGRIGRELASLARGLAMDVHYLNRRRLAPALEAGATFHENEQEFLGRIDFLSINAPGGEATRGWLNAARLGMMKQSAIVVNTGRGSLVDDAALIAALREGRIAGAGLDVFNNEPALDPGYLGLENVVLLPHIGSATIETRDAMGFLALDGIDAVLKTAR